MAAAQIGEGISSSAAMPEQKDTPSVIGTDNRWISDGAPSDKRLETGKFRAGRGGSRRCGRAGKPRRVCAGHACRDRRAPSTARDARVSACGRPGHDGSKRLGLLDEAPSTGQSPVSPAMMTASYAFVSVARLLDQ